MSNLTAFLMENAEKIENVKVVVSDRFRDENGNAVPWEIRPLTEEEMSAIRKRCTKREKLKDGSYQEKQDVTETSANMVVESVVFPNLKDADLQNSYRAMGATNLIRKMLTAGEYANLMFTVQDISGFDKDINELVDEAKN